MIYIYNFQVSPFIFIGLFRLAIQDRRAFWVYPFLHDLNCIVQDKPILLQLP